MKTIFASLLLLSLSWMVKAHDVHSCEVAPLEVATDSAVVEEAIVYPNPFSQSTTISFPNEDNQSFSLVVTNVKGEVVRKVEGITQNTHTFDRGDLSVGTYVFELASDDKVYRGKLLIDNI